MMILCADVVVVWMMVVIFWASRAWMPRKAVARPCRRFRRDRLVVRQCGKGDYESTGCRADGLYRPQLRRRVGDRY